MSPSEHYREAERLVASIAELNDRLASLQPRGRVYDLETADLAAQIAAAMPDMIAYAQLHYLAAALPRTIYEIALIEQEATS